MVRKPKFKHGVSRYWLAVYHRDRNTVYESQLGVDWLPTLSPEAYADILEAERTQTEPPFRATLEKEAVQAAVRRYSISLANLARKGVRSKYAEKDHLQEGP